MKKTNKMRKAFLVLAAAAVMLLALCGSAFAAPITIELDGHIIKSDVAPRAVQGRTCVPVRVISEALCADVQWGNNTVTITNTEGDVFSVKAGAQTATLAKANTREYKTIKLDVPAKAYSGRVFVPLRVAAEALGVQVDYQAAGGGKVILSSTPVEVNGKPLNSMTTHWYMTMGGKITGYFGNANVARIYKLLSGGKGQEMAAPENFSRMYNLDFPQFTLDCEYSFYTGKPNIEQKGLINWTVYQATNPGEDNPGIYVGYALYDEDAKKWYKFSEDAFNELAKALETMSGEELLNDIV